MIFRRSCNIFKGLASLFTGVTFGHKDGEADVTMLNHCFDPGNQITLWLWSPLIVQLCAQGVV